MDIKPDEMVIDLDGELRRYGDSAAYKAISAKSATKTADNAAEAAKAAAKAASKAEWLQQRANAKQERKAKLADKIRITETKLDALRRELAALT